MVAALGLAGISTAFSLIKMLGRRSESSGSSASENTQGTAQTGQNLPTGGAAPAKFDPAALFASLDADKSGGISKDELVTGLKNARGGASSGGGSFDTRTFGALLSVQEASQKSTRADKLFSKLDTDGNGSISADELTTALTGGKQVEANKNGLDALFNSIDKNKDGTISAEELKAAMENASRHGHNRHHHGQAALPAATSTDSTATSTATTGITSAAATTQQAAA